MSLLTIGVGFIFAVGASAEPPLGIIGEVTVQNDASDPVPVVVQGSVVVEEKASTPVTSGLQVEIGVSCFSRFSIFKVPIDKLLIIEDASASAIPNDQNNPINPNISIQLSLETTVSGKTTPSIIGGGLGLPNSFGRTMRTYADPDTEVFLGVSSCTEQVNTEVSFTGRLVDIP
jgi:hypothetical protein